MKKLSLFLVVFLLVGAMVMAEDEAAKYPTAEEATAALETVETLAASPIANASATVKGSGSVTWGVNLDEFTTGFTNSTSASFAVTLVPKYADTHGAAGEESVYGEIAIKDITASAGGASAAFNYAKIVLSPDLSIKIAGAPGDLGTNYEAISGGIVGIATTDTLAPTALVTSGGITVNYSIPDVASIALALGSHNAWDAIGATGADNGYATKLTVGVSAVENLSLSMGAALGFMYEDGAGNAVEQDTMLGASLGYGIAMGETMKLTPKVGFDLLMPAGGADAQTALSVDLNMDLGGGGVDAAGLMGADAASGLSVGTSIDLTGADPVIDLTTTFAEGGGLVENLAAAVGFEVADVANFAAANAGLAAYLGYSIDNIKPWASFKMTALEDGQFLMMAGVNVSNFITRTSLALTYTSGDLAAAEPVLGTVETKVSISY